LRGWAFALARQPEHLPEAEGAFREAIQCFERAAAKDPLRPSSPCYAADTHRRVGRVFALRGLRAEALAEYSEAIRLHEELLARLPNPSYGQWERFDAFVEYARLLAQSGQIDRAKTIYGRAIALQPERADAYNGLAWLLATCSDARFRDPTRAVELASEAVKWAPNAPENQNTLGVARYRAGNWRGAIEALTKSEELAPGKSLGFNAFFLAMAHWQLGHKDEASQCYGRAVKWIERNKLNDEELSRFRAEAASLLGLEARTDRQGQHAPSHDAAVTDRVLHADSSAARDRRDHSIGQSADAAMPNGPNAFAKP
jgi:tetratricopeptide (TPR) repeat protein